MSTRGTILLAIGMLVLGLLLGALGGGAAGFFIGQNAQPAISQALPPTIPQMPFIPPRRFPPTMTAPSGARVIQVEKDSPAAKAGLQVGDVITAVGGVEIDEKNSLADLIQKRKPGDKVELTVTRGAQTLTLNVELGAAPQKSDTAYLGVRFAPVFPDGRRFQFRFPGSNLPDG